MPHSDIFDPVITPIERPPCPKCGALMWLTRVEPDKPDHDTRTFECPECENSETVLTKYR